MGRITPFNIALQPTRDAGIFLFRLAFIVLGTTTAVVLQLAATRAAVPERERQILMDLFEKTNGQEWTNREGWGTSRPVYDWHGVKCDFVDGNIERPIVTGLSLAMNNLRGHLPATLANLEHLNVLDVAGNDLTGLLPSHSSSVGMRISSSSREMAIRSRTSSLALVWNIRHPASCARSTRTFDSISISLRPGTRQCLRAYVAPIRIRDRA